MDTPYQPAPLIAELKATYRQGTNLMSNVYHVKSDTEWTQIELEELCSLFYDWENAHGKLSRSLSVELTYLTAAALYSEDGPYNAKAIDPAVGGLNATQALPLNVTAAITAVTGTRGRGTQGRTFWIGLAEDQVDENVLTNTAQSVIVGQMNLLRDAISARVGWTLVILHRIKHGELLPLATSSTVLVYTVRDTTIDTQKNRLPNHRRASSMSDEKLCDLVVKRGGTCSFP